MALPRFQLFEFSDSAWAPAPLRETLISALSRTLRWGRVLDGLVDPFARFLATAGTTRVLELCSGAGGPARIFSEALAAQGVEAHFLLSDLSPHVEAWRALTSTSPRLDFIDRPVDVTLLDAGVGAGRVRSIVNALHHFPPAQARQVLEGACRGAPGVFVAEGLERNLLSFASMAIAGAPALVATPFFVRDRAASALLTWASPLSLAASVWDGSVSCLRTYNEAELRDLVSGLPAWRWEFGIFRHGPFGRGSYFMGWPEV